MNARALILLGLGTVLAVGLALTLVDRWGQEPARTAGDQPLVPGLAERVNEIAAIDIVAPSGDRVASLRRERERWRLREMHDYEADFARIHDLLRDLSGARRLEPRTDDPKWHARLGVAEPGSQEGGGTLVRFPQSDLPGIIVGQADPAGIGRYARLEADPRVWLADRVPEVPAERLEWLERAIMDIPAAELAEVSIRHPDGQVLELRPGDAQGENWVLLNAPTGREVKPSWQIRQSADALARLNMENVRPNESLPASPVRALFRTRDGLDFVARLFEADGEYWVNFSVAVSPQASGEADSGEGEGQDESPESTDGGARSQRDIDAVAVDGRLAPWQFAISERRYELMTRRIVDFLAPLDEDMDEAP